MAITPPVNNLYLLQDTEIYDTREGTGKPVGVVSAYQSVKANASYNESGDLEHPQTYRIETWLGDKWIKADNSRMINGTLQEMDQTITTIYELPLYDHPGTPANLAISPQKLHATARLSYIPFTFSNTFGANAGSGIWYRIDTWLGEKWILKPTLLEDVQENPVSYDIKLGGKETAYPHPFMIAADAEPVETQIVHVTAEWETRKGPGTGEMWLKIKLPQGERWIMPQNPTIRDYRALKESVTLPTETRRFAAPSNDIDVKTTLKPGTYDAFEASGDWVHVRTADGDVWVNPKRALLERPVGIVKTDEKIALTKDTATFRYPLTGEPAHLQGFYAPQTVQALEKWVSPTGDVWYCFHGTGLDEWMKIP